MTIESQAQDLLFDVSGGVARITINRPEARNACTFEMYEKLAQACEAVNADNSVWVLLLTGAGEKAFSAGTDIAVFKDFKTPEDALGYEVFMDRIHGGLENCQVPTIAVIAGACTGGASLLPPAAIYASRQRIEVRFSHRPNARELPVDNNLARLAGLIGARGEGYDLHRRLFDAKEALEIGFLNGLAKDRVALDRPCRSLPAQMASFAPLTFEQRRKDSGESGTAAPGAGRRSRSSCAI